VRARTIKPAAPIAVLSLGSGLDATPWLPHDEKSPVDAAALVMSNYCCTVGVHGLMLGQGVDVLIGHIEKRGGWWVAECEVVGGFTQGRSRAEAMNNLAEVVELRVAKPRFEVNVSEFEKRGRNSFSVLLEPSEPAWLAAAVLKYQRARHRLSLADVAKSLRSASRNAYASYEQGAREPTLGKFRELLTAVAPEMTMILEPRSPRKIPARKVRRVGARKGA